MANVYQIEVEIPKGKYCQETHKDIWCDYLGMASPEAGYCPLIIGDDSIVHWDEEDKPIEKRKHCRIIKHPNCPSLRK